MVGVFGSEGGGGVNAQPSTASMTSKNIGRNAAVLPAAQSWFFVRGGGGGGAEGKQRRFGRTRSMKGFLKKDPNETNHDDLYEENKQIVLNRIMEQLVLRRKKHEDDAAAFLPRLMQEPEVKNRGENDLILHKCHGCVVFSDASGFTKLTETLAQRSDGAEVLSACLNKFFTPLIDLIEAYRGDVIKFSGDALSILFQATDDYELCKHPCGSPEAPKKTPLQLACLRAAACCLEIHKRLHNFDTGEDNVRLTLHIGVGAGAITLLQLGGTYTRYEYVLAGPPLEQIAVAEPLAGSGETVMSLEAWKEVKDTVIEGEPLENAPPGFHRLKALDTSLHTYPTVKWGAQECTRIEYGMRGQCAEPGSILAVAQRFIPRAVLRRPVAHSWSINEMRTVTMVFAQIGGIDVSTEFGAKKAQELMLGMQRACYYMEGNLNKNLVDDKGLLFLFAFGLPPLMHVDDPARAVMSSFDMIKALQGMGLSGKFGVTTGRVFCGIVGSSSRREYTVMGDTVNLAARLMSKAHENSVLIDDVTYKQISRDVICTSLGEIQVKGKTIPIKVYEPVPPKVHGLDVRQLGAHLDFKTWGLQKTDIKVSLEPAFANGATGAHTTVTIPWRATSKLLGGTSPVLQLTRWRDLQTMHEMLTHHEKGLLSVGGALLFFGLSGGGKQELAEYLINKATDAKLIPLVGYQRSRNNQRFRMVADLMQSCLRILCKQVPGSYAAGNLDDAAEHVLQQFIPQERRLYRVLGFLGFETFDVPNEHAQAESSSMPEMEAARGAAEILVILIKQIAKVQGVLVFLRYHRSTDTIGASTGEEEVFWMVRSELSELAMEREQEILKARSASASMEELGGVHAEKKPIMVVTMARYRDMFPKLAPPKAEEDESSRRATVVSHSSGPPQRQRSGSKSPRQGSGSSTQPAIVKKPPYVHRKRCRELDIRHMTEDAAVEFMCLCLGLQTTLGGSLVKRPLREFTVHTSSQLPTYIQECLQHLLMEGVIKLKGPETPVEVGDLNSVNIANWVHTAMVTTPIASLEMMPTKMQYIMRLATVFEGPFSPLDLAAASRVLFGKLPRMLALFDQSKLLKNTQELMKEGYLTSVSVGLQAPPEDGASPWLPRWRISNKLFKKVAGSTLLNSQKILIKRAVLIDRALNVCIPKRMREHRHKRPQLQVGGVHMAPPIPESSPAISTALESDATQKTGSRDSKRADSKPTPLASPTMSTNTSHFLPVHVPDNPENAQETFDMLISACALGTREMVIEILSQRPDTEVNQHSDLGGYTPLHFACSSGDVDIVQLLCDRGAAVDAKSFKSETPLLVAAQRGHLEVVQYLCESHNANALCGYEQANMWDRELKDIHGEEDMPKPLTPMFAMPPQNVEQERQRRRQVHNWLKDWLAKEGSTLRHSLSERPSQRDPMQTSHSDSQMGHRRSLVGSIGEVEEVDSRMDRRTSYSDAPNLQKQESSAMLPAMPPPPLHRGNSAGQNSQRLSPARTLANAVIPLPIRQAPIRAKARAFLRSKFCMVLMLVVLCLALYMPDVWVAVGATSNLGIDVVLSGVMLLFLAELTLLSLVDSSYPCSFFFFMDCIGTVSMIWDISYILGPDATQPQESQDGQQDLTLFRATRMAKIGARAGRLSRLVKVMRFLPGIGVRGNESNEAEKLQQISNQLTNVLSKRVACLTILLVIVMPLFTLGLYPEADFSMQVWIEALARRAQDAAEAGDSAAAAADFVSTLEQFVAFYQGRDYGPYQVCVEADGSSSSISGCYDLRAAPYKSSWDAPHRRSFQLDVTKSPVSASFDFSHPTMSEANMGIALISLVIVLMCGACLLLNYSASELAVRPLERMLTSIKKSARTIFSSVAALGPEDNDEDFGEDMDGEVALLERVVQKIAILAELSSKKNPYDEATLTGMKSEELGVLALTSLHHSAQAAPTQAVEGDQRTGDVTVTMQWQLEEIGIPYEVLNSWEFNILELEPKKQQEISAWLLMNYPGSSPYTESNVDIQTLRSFVRHIEKGYQENPYHNFMHAVDITHCVFRYMKLMQSEVLFTQLEQFSMLVAGISHDVGHTGLTNVFLTEVHHDLAIRYNDRSPLENMHCAKLFEVLAQGPDCNVFSGTTADQYRSVRKTIIDVILHTDIQQHPSMVKELELLYEMNSKVFDPSRLKLSEAEIEVLTAAESKKLLLRVLLHAADIANSTKPWKIAFGWAHRVLDEYANQGDQERRLGIPVQMLNDREKVNRPNSQIGFIEFIVAPLVAAEVKIFRSWCESSEFLEQNLRSWERLWIEETSPSEAEKDKVKERVQKIVLLLSNRPATSKTTVHAKADHRQRRTSFATG